MELTALPWRLCPARGLVGVVARSGPGYDVSIGNSQPGERLGLKLGLGEGSSRVGEVLLESLLRSVVSIGGTPRALKLLDDVPGSMIRGETGTSSVKS
jgi:hypothetical protein